MKVLILLTFMVLGMILASVVDGIDLRYKTPDGFFKPYVTINLSDGTVYPKPVKFWK